jgi:hypothetical protein
MYAGIEIAYTAARRLSAYSIDSIISVTNQILDLCHNDQFHPALLLCRCSCLVKVLNLNYSLAFFLAQVMSSRLLSIQGDSEL